MIFSITLDMVPSFGIRRIFFRSRVDLLVNIKMLSVIFLKFSLPLMNHFINYINVLVHRFTCLSTFTGSECEFFIPCGSNPCTNGATCRNAANSVFGTPYTCDCPTNFEGAACEVQDFCAANPCPSGVPCLNLVDTFECDYCASE